MLASKVGKVDSKVDKVDSKVDKVLSFMCSLVFSKSSFSIIP